MKQKALSASSLILVCLLFPWHFVKLLLICKCPYHLIGFQAFGGTEAGIWPAATAETSFIPSQTMRYTKCKYFRSARQLLCIKLGFVSSLLKTTVSADVHKHIDRNIRFIQFSVQNRKLVIAVWSIIWQRRHLNLSLCHEGQLYKYY